MGTRRGRSLRAVLAGALVFGGLTTASVVAASALTAGAVSASTVSLFTSSGTGFVPTAATVPSDVCFVEVTAVGGTGNAGGAGGSTTARIQMCIRDSRIDAPARVVSIAEFGLDD